MSSSILTKFKVGSVTDFGNDNQEVKLSAFVSNDSDENKSFSKYTPSGSISIHISNPDAIDFFTAGEKYYVAFSKAD